MFPDYPEDSLIDQSCDVVTSRKGKPRYIIALVTWLASSHVYSMSQM